MKKWSWIFLLVLAAPAIAQKKGTPGVFDYYLLTLSWSPEFCTTKPSDPQCTGTHQFGFVVHGMWPQFNDNTWPQDCSNAPGLADPSTMLDIMPSETLIAHEWSKHGTCSGLDAKGYFDLTRQAFQGVKIPAAYQAPKKTLTVKLADLKKAFETANPSLSNTNFSAGCSGKQLSQVQICLDKQLHPMACKTNDTCTTTPIVMPPVRAHAAAKAAAVPSPLLKAGQPVDWWFAFKFNSDTGPQCSNNVQRKCAFGGTVQTVYSEWGLQYAYASSADPTPALQAGSGCLGESTADPVGATFNQIYNGTLFYVLWNDQFHGDPIPNASSPAGHSKGILAWDANGNGVVLQVSTPSWPGSGTVKLPRKSGNTLGCVQGDNDILVSQHFFALKLNSTDVVAVLTALANSSVVTDLSKPQIANIGGPAAIVKAAKLLGPHSTSKKASKVALSSGVVLISKPSNLNVPPWQMVSALLGGEPLRAATWWATPEIPTTTSAGAPGCWDASLGTPGPVEIATSGTWNGASIGLEGLPDADGNHAKVGVSTGTHKYAIFGDMNQQGSLGPPKKCNSSQDGRGGLFFVVENEGLFKTVSALIKGGSAPPQ